MCEMIFTEAGQKGVVLLAGIFFMFLFFVLIAIKS